MITACEAITVASVISTKVGRLLVQLDVHKMTAGVFRYGELSASQLFHARPAAGYADLRTPIRGLYQAGSGTHGGGGVTGIPGRNAVTQVLHDLRRARLRSRYQDARVVLFDEAVGILRETVRRNRVSGRG